LIRFQFENEYSWFREKVVSYKVTVTPPSIETLGAGRRRRAKACLKAVQEDSKSATKRWSAAVDQRSSMEREIAQLEKQLEQKQKSLRVVVTEEKWLNERVTLRKEQKKLLEERMVEGWADENLSTTKKNGK
jgi:Fic family protein